MKTATNDSKVYRPEFAAHLPGRAHSRHPERQRATRIEGKGGIKVRLDSGKEVELTAKQARHIEHGYAVESGRRVSAEQFIVTGDATETKLLVEFPSTRETSPFTSRHQRSSSRKPLSGRRPGSE